MEINIESTRSNIVIQVLIDINKKGYSWKDDVMFCCYSASQNLEFNFLKPLNEKVSYVVRSSRETEVHFYRGGFLKDTT